MSLVAAIVSPLLFARSGFDDLLGRCRSSDGAAPRSSPPEQASGRRSAQVVHDERFRHPEVVGADERFGDEAITHAGGSGRLLVHGSGRRGGPPLLAQVVRKRARPRAAGALSARLLFSAGDYSSPAARVIAPSSAEAEPATQTGLRTVPRRRLGITRNRCGGSTPRVALPTRCRLGAGACGSQGGEGEP